MKWFYKILASVAIVLFSFFIPADIRTHAWGWLALDVVCVLVGIYLFVSSTDDA